MNASVLVLDFGGVVTRTLFETHALTEQSLGLPRGTLGWRGPFDPANDALWREMQAERISERDYWMARTREVGRLLGEDWNEMQTFVRRARGGDVMATIRPEALHAITTAHAAGRRLALLSNELDLFYGAQMRTELPLLGLFELIVDATHTGILKPDRRAYGLVTERLGVAPNTCVFVDDQQRNVEGARRTGMQALHFDVMQPLASFERALQLLGMPATQPDDRIDAPRPAPRPQRAKGTP